MRKLLAMAACGVGIWGFAACGSDSGSGGSSASDPVEACKEITQITCDKVFKCLTPAQLEMYKAVFGLNSGDCVIKFNADCIPEKANCKAGQTYHADKGQQCIDGVKNYTCDDLLDPNTPDPAACDQRCSASLP
jgi:hypothetical protein